MVTPLTLEELGKQTEKRKAYQRDKIRAFMKESYHYAKSLGFSASEAGVLQHHGKETIYRLSQERKEKENAK